MGTGFLWITRVAVKSVPNRMMTRRKTMKRVGDFLNAFGTIRPSLEGEFIAWAYELRRECFSSRRRIKLLEDENAQLMGYDSYDELGGE
jgi:hypothetical protein